MGRLAAYRSTGADLPFGDPGRAHGVAMEGYFWSLQDPESGQVVVALCGVNRAPDGSWATVALAAHPSGFVRSAAVPVARADPERLGASASGAFAATAERLRVELADDARLDLRLFEPVGWPRRSFGVLGLAHAVPGLDQYWYPHLLGARVEGAVRVGDQEVRLDGFRAYAEKNWGDGFPSLWWWGQASGFDRDDVAVAFAGGPVRIGPVRVPVSAVVVRLGRELVVLRPPLGPVRASVGEGRWALRGRGARHGVELEAEAGPDGGVRLPVPIHDERRNVAASRFQLAGRLRVRVTRRGRTVFAGESGLACLERGSFDQRARALDDTWPPGAVLVPEP